MTALLIRGNALGINSSLITNPILNGIQTVLSSQLRQISGTAPSFTIRILNLGSMPTTKSRFRICPSRGATQTITSGHVSRRHVSHLRRTVTSHQMALGAVSTRIRRKSLGSLGLLLGTSMRKSVRTVLTTLRRLPRGRIRVQMLLTTPNRVDRASISLTTTDNTIVINFGAALTPNTQRSTSHLNMSMHSCRIVCGLLSSVRKTVRNLLSPRVIRRPLNRMRIHTIFPMHGNTITNYCILSKGIAQGYGLHIIHNNDIICANGLSSLGQVGRSTGSITTNFRYNVNVSDFDS